MTVCSRDAKTVVRDQWISSLFVIKQGSRGNKLPYRGKLWWGEN